jgi:hypothetical protein
VTIALNESDVRRRSPAPTYTRRRPFALVRRVDLFQSPLMFTPREYCPVDVLDGAFSCADDIAVGTVCPALSNALSFQEWYVPRLLTGHKMAPRFGGFFFPSRALLRNA